jgi:trk system potassium uptake protein TrkA
MGIDSYDCLIATTDRDEKNIVIASTAKKLGAAKAVARLRDPEHMRQRTFVMDLFGIDYVANPDLDVAEEINKYLVEKYTLSNGILYIGRVSLLEFIAGKIPDVVGRTTKEAEQILTGMRVVAVSKNGKVVIPGTEDVIIGAENDLYVVGERDIVEKLSKKVFERGKYTDIQKVMIAGGGKAGLYLARMLEHYGASVKIIDSDKGRCQYLSTHLHSALILHADATDVEVLREENFEDMDAFVSVTGFDEENLLLALMAKKAGIEDVIAKISRESFGNLIENMGVDMVLNPVDISANHILRFLQGSKIISSQIIQGQAELILIAIDDDMVLSDKPIARLKLPPGMIIAAIQRGAEVIIPDEHTRVEEGDRVIILSLLSDAFDLEKLLRNKQGFWG